MTAFELCGLLALPFWALMVFLPAWSVTRRIVGSPWIVAPAAIIDSIVLIPVATLVLLVYLVARTGIGGANVAADPA